MTGFPRALRILGRIACRAMIADATPLLASKTYSPHTSSFGKATTAYPSGSSTENMSYLDMDSGISSTAIVPYRGMDFPAGVYDVIAPVLCPIAEFLDAYSLVLSIGSNPAAFSPQESKQLEKLEAFYQTYKTSHLSGGILGTTRQNIASGTRGYSTTAPLSDWSSFLIQSWNSTKPKPTAPNPTQHRKEHTLDTAATEKSIKPVKIPSSIEAPKKFNLMSEDKIIDAFSKLAGFAFSSDGTEFIKQYITLMNSEEKLKFLSAFSHAFQKVFENTGFQPARRVEQTTETVQKIIKSGVLWASEARSTHGSGHYEFQVFLPAKESSLYFLQKLLPSCSDFYAVFKTEGKEADLFAGAGWSMQPGPEHLAKITPSESELKLNPGCAHELPILFASYIHEAKISSLRITTNPEGIKAEELWEAAVFLHKAQRAAACGILLTLTAENKIKLNDDVTQAIKATLDETLASLDRFTRIPAKLLANPETKAALDFLKEKAMAGAQVKKAAGMTSRAYSATPLRDAASQQKGPAASPCRSHDIC